MPRGGLNHPDRMGGAGVLVGVKVGAKRDVRVAHPAGGVLVEDLCGEQRNDVLAGPGALPHAAVVLEVEQPAVDL